MKTSPTNIRALQGYRDIHCIAIVNSGVSLLAKSLALLEHKGFLKNS